MADIAWRVLYYKGGRGPYRSGLLSADNFEDAFQQFKDSGMAYDEIDRVVKTSLDGSGVETMEVNGGQLSGQVMRL